MDFALKKTTGATVKRDPGSAHMGPKDVHNDRNAKVSDADIAFRLVELSSALITFHRHMEELEGSLSGKIEASERSAALRATRRLLAVLQSSGIKPDEQRTAPIVNSVDGLDADNSSDSKRSSLTAREKQVLDLVVAGATSREGALSIKISPRTYEGHRARIMLKLRAKNVADLVSKGLGLGIKPSRFT